MFDLVYISNEVGDVGVPPILASSILGSVFSFLLIAMKDENITIIERVKQENKKIFFTFILIHFIGYGVILTPHIFGI
jgi:hypothetical protein